MTQNSPLSKLYSIIRLLLWLINAAAIISLSCARRPLTKPPMPPEMLLKNGIEYLNQGNYKEAKRSFNEIIFKHPGSIYVEDAQFYLAESYFKSKEYLLAKEEYDFFLKNFPVSKYQEEASYKYVCAVIFTIPKKTFDQNEILTAKEFILNFKDRYPDSPFLSKMDSLLIEIHNRLAKKEFDAGFLYYQAGELVSAKTYFEYVAKEFPETATAMAASYLLGQICLKNGNKEEAREIFEDLLQKPIDEKIKEKIKRLLRLM